jgi:hypothetical protein
MRDGKVTKTQSDKDTKLVVTTNCENSKMRHCDLSMISHRVTIVICPSIANRRQQYINICFHVCVVLLPLLFINSTHYHIIAY